jgi:hypothetical protein
MRCSSSQTRWKMSARSWRLAGVVLALPEDREVFEDLLGLVEVGKRAGGVLGREGAIRDQPESMYPVLIDHRGSFSSRLGSCLALPARKR